MKNRVAFIIPGYGFKVSRREYKEIAEAFLGRDIIPVGIDIDWHKSMPRDFYTYVKEFLAQAKKHKASEVYVLGFSLGAVTALLAAGKLKPKALILCSLSPYFEEDLVTIKKAWCTWWRKHYKNKLVFKDVIKGLRAETHLLVGGKEDTSCITRGKEAHKLINGSKLSIIKGVEHKLQQEAYVRKIAKVIKAL